MGFICKECNSPIGVITIRNCVAFNNGTLSNGVHYANGDMNGFKLGGSGVGTPHNVMNCLSFDNGATGFTDNNNPTGLTIVMLQHGATESMLRRVTSYVTEHQVQQYLRDLYQQVQLIQISLLVKWLIQYITTQVSIIIFQVLCLLL